MRISRREFLKQTARVGQLGMAAWLAQFVPGLSLKTLAASNGHAPDRFLVILSVFGGMDVTLD